MDDNLDEEMTEFEEQIADEVGHTGKDEGIQPRKQPSPGFKPRRKTLILGGAGILLLIVLIAIFSGGDGELSTADLSAIQARLNHFERRLTGLEGMQDRIVLLEKQQEGTQQPMVETDRSVTALTERMDKLTQRMDQVEKRFASVAAKTETPYAIQRKPPSLAERRYHEVRPGENLYRIAIKYGISVDELCRLNNITPEQVIHSGQKLLVTPDSQQ